MADLLTLGIEIGTSAARRATADLNALAESARQAGVVLAALDALAVALTDHDHVWTDRERKLYEDATRSVQPPAMVQSEVTGVFHSAELQQDAPVE